MKKLLDALYFEKHKCIDARDTLNEQSDFPDDGYSEKLHSLELAHQLETISLLDAIIEKVLKI